MCVWTRMLLVRDDRLHLNTPSSELSDAVWSLPPAVSCKVLGEAAEGPHRSQWPRWAFIFRQTEFEHQTCSASSINTKQMIFFSLPDSRGHGTLTCWVRAAGVNAVIFSDNYWEKGMKPILYSSQFPLKYSCLVEIKCIRRQLLLYLASFKPTHQQLSVEEGNIWISQRGISDWML